jgi:carbon storage regulator CsrA
MSRLVLSRRVDETVVIHKNGEIVSKVKVSRINRGQVALTFEADETINIDRQEIYNAKTDNK